MARAAPPQADIDAATTTIRELYEKDVRRAAQPQQRAQVVRMFLQLANDETLAAAESYAMLQLAVDIAGQGDDLRLFQEAIRAFTAGFEGVDDDGMLLAHLIARDREAMRLREEHLVTALELNERLRAAERFEQANAAVALAETMLKKVDGPTAARFRNRIADCAVMTRSEADVAAAARTARDVLAKDPADGMANLQVGLHAAIRGKWPQACDHLRKSSRDDVRKAADAEATAEDKPQLLCVAADAWWDVIGTESESGADPGVAAAAGGGQALPLCVLRALKSHVAELYGRALDRGLEGQHMLSGKRARNRVDEMRKSQLQVGQEEEKRKHDLPGVPAAFDADAFGRVEGQRMEEWRRFRDAVRAGQKQDYDRAVRGLANIRPQWCRLLQPSVRNAALPQRKQALQQAVGRDRQCADLHLCMAYLHILNGDKTDATRSFDESLRLIKEDPMGQVFCPRQLLDLAGAAIMVGNIDSAKAINNNFLQRRFPNDPAVLEVQAMLWVEQPQPRFADAIDKLREAHGKTKDDDRAAVAARLAWLLAAVPRNTNLRMPAEADKMADEAIQKLQGRSWWALRAKAELRASENKWAEALDLLAQAEVQAPLLHADDIAKQRECYRAKQPFEIERKK